MNKLVLSIFIGVILIFGGFAGTAHATQFIPYINVSMPSNPRICVYDNIEGDKHFAEVQAGVKEWQDKLNYLTHSKNWNMTVHLVDKTGIAYCNIWYHFTIERSDLIDIGTKTGGKVDLGSIQGSTLCGYQGAGDNQDSKCEIRFFVLNVKPETFPQVIRHEFGHALGLGHRIGDNQKDAMRAFLSDDLMYPYTKKFSHLTNEDALAVIKLYGVHGFHYVVNYPPPYTIDYPTNVKVYCNGVNGTICIKHF